MPRKGGLGFRYFTYFYTRSCSTWLTMLLGGLADKANEESRNCWEIRYVVQTMFLVEYLKFVVVDSALK